MNDTYETPSPNAELQARAEIAPNSVRRMAKLASPLLIATIILVAFNSIIFKVTNYYYWVKPDSTMGLIVQTRDSVLHQLVAGKKNIIVMGDSRVSEGFSAAVANKVSNRTDINFIEAGIPGTSPRVWYYFLKNVDPDRKLFSGVVLMVHDYDDYHNDTDFSNFSLDLKYLLPITDFRDTFTIANSFSGFHNKIDALGTLMTPIVTASDDLYDFFASPDKRISDAQSWHEHFYQWSYSYAGSTSAVPTLDAAHFYNFDFTTQKWNSGEISQMQRYISFMLGEINPVDPELTAQYRNQWYGGIAAAYSAAKVPVMIFQIPRGPYEQYDQRTFRTDGSLRDLQAAGRLTLLDQRAFELIEKPENFHDALHVNQRGRELLSAAVASAVTTQISSGK
ncbi:MAG: hypothetical protein AB1704_19690 [Pseudomonadota bacterium]